MTRLIRNKIIITRFILALVFLAAGASMIDQYGLAQAYMLSTGLPGALLPWFILVVIAAAVSLIAGYRLEWAALAMALLAVTSALLLPGDYADHALNVAFFRNTAVASVLLLMIAGLAGCRGKDRRTPGTDRSTRIQHNLLTHRSH
jgi:putative oxidoreductase